MPLRLTSAPVAGIQKRKSNTTSKPRSSPFAGYRRRKLDVGGTSTSKSNQSLAGSNNSTYTADEQLDDVGISHYIADTTPVKDVIEAIRYIGNTMFEEMPTSRSGMNSTRIAQVLNMRRSLPPLVSVAHVHTLLDDSTRVEREIVDLVNKGRLRRLIVPGRGNDAAGLGDCLVLAEDWENVVRESSDLEESAKGMYCILFPVCCATGLI